MLNLCRKAVFCIENEFIYILTWGCALLHNSHEKERKTNQVLDYGEEEDEDARVCRRSSRKNEAKWEKQVGKLSVEWERKRSLTMEGKGKILRLDFPCLTTAAIFVRSLRKYPLIQFQLCHLMNEMSSAVSSLRSLIRMYATWWWRVLYVGEKIGWNCLHFLLLPLTQSFCVTFFSLRFALFFY